MTVRPRTSCSPRRARHACLAPTSVGGRVAVLGLAVVASAPAFAAEVTGVVLDAVDERPVAGVRVVAVEVDDETTTGDDGTFAIEIGDLPHVTLVPLVGDEEVDEAVRWVRQGPGRLARLHVFAPGAAPVDGMDWGAPLAVRPVDADPPPAGPVTIPDWVAPGPLGLTLPPEIPSAIRVGRRFASSCSGNPVQRIDTVPLEEYAEGVLIPEIGVFRAVEGGPDSAAAVFEAFAVAARAYALWFYFRDPDAAYHLDDTACNQRYEDARAPWVAERVAATEGELMVQASDPTVLEKFEYAASCGEYGTLPEFQESTVPDETALRACVGTWCGHDTCAGHEVNPAVPEEGRCFVRGICQWGAVERSMEGDSYLTILAHYQPNLAVISTSETVDPVEPPDVGGPDVGDRDTGAPPDTGVVDTGIADTGAAADTGVPDADGPDTPEDLPPTDAPVTRRAPSLYSVVDPREPSVRGCTTTPSSHGWPAVVGALMVAAAIGRRRRPGPATAAEP